MRSNAVLFLLCVSGAAPLAAADVTFTVTIDDPTSQLAGYESRLTSHLLAAGAAWAEHLVGDAVLSIRVRPTTIVPFSSGYSFSSYFVGTADGFDIFEQSAAAHLRLGTNQFPGNPDIEFIINKNYMIDTLWFDPNPTVRTATPDPTRTDAMSVCIHELGHALAFNGWMDGFDGSLPGNYKSPFDDLVEFDGTDFWFNGLTASSVYGGPLPVTYGNPFHIGNASPRPGSDLIGQLMNGVVFSNGQRYFISQLDWAILKDVGVNVAPSCTSDVDFSGNVDLSDFFLFLNCFDQTQPCADTDGNPGIDLGDFFAFLNAFDEGC